jgi:multiple sugar transport system ATP-binding protein
MSHIRIERLSKSYRNRAALTDIELEIEPRSFTVFCGPPGCGKSVLMRIIIGLEPPTSGRIYVDGEDITDLPAAARRMGYVPQSFALFPHMSVFDNVAYPMALQGVPRAEIAARVGQAAEMLHIGQLLQKRPAQLSGGEKQRAAIARGILKNADIFILDDPLVGLDFKLREGLMDDLKDLRAELDATFLYITSDSLEALTMAENLVVLDQGRVVQSGRVEDVYYHPAALRSAELVGFPRCNILPGRIDGAHCATSIARFPVLLDRHGGDVMVMIRPESISYDRGYATASGEIRLIENLGAESVIYFDAGGETLVTTAPSPAVAGLDIGAPFPFTLRPGTILLYDGQSGTLIGRGRETARA